MKLTKSKLKQMIKEEIQKLNEAKDIKSPGKQILAIIKSNPNLIKVLESHENSGVLLGLVRDALNDAIKQSTNEEGGIKANRAEILGMARKWIEIGKITLPEGTEEFGDITGEPVFEFDPSEDYEPDIGEFGQRGSLR